MNTKKTKTKNILISAVLAGVFSFGGSKVLASDITSENVGYLINQERTYYGLEPLKVDLDLTAAATAKSADMLQRHYFEHYAYGLSPWDFIKKADYNYLYAGENLAMDFQTSEGMIRAWMNSSLHRDNILDPDFDEMGIGVVKGAYTENGQSHETKIVTNMFGRKKSAVYDFFDKLISKMSDFFYR